MAAIRIRAIERGAVHRICSGQVVLDMATAVKELVENSLDAGATNIEIRLKECGAELIEVADNGSGVSPDNYQALTLKYHTSKISDFSDLQTLSSFGFRGEALSSLCALSDVTITTRTKNEAVAARLEFDHSGRLISQASAARAVGTTVAVARLFSPLPVRYKELQRNVKREYGRLAAVLQAYALIASGVRLVCTNQTGRSGRTTLVQTQGFGTLRDNIVTVFGSKTAACLEPVGAEVAENCRLSGFVSKAGAGCGRASGDRQFFYLNGRPVDLPRASKLINEVYRAFNSLQFPMAIINFTLPTDSYDVNLTPDKRKVMLHAESALMAALKHALEKVYASDSCLYSVKEFKGTSKRLSGSAGLDMELGTQSKRKHAAVEESSEEDDDDAADALAGEAELPEKNELSSEAERAMHGEEGHNQMVSTQVMAVEGVWRSHHREGERGISHEDEGLTESLKRNEEGMLDRGTAAEENVVEGGLLEEQGCQGRVREEGGEGGGELKPTSVIDLKEFSLLQKRDSGNNRRVDDKWSNVAGKRPWGVEEGGPPRKAAKVQMSLKQFVMKKATVGEDGSAEHEGKEGRTSSDDGVRGGLKPEEDRLLEGRAMNGSDCSILVEDGVREKGGKGDRNEHLCASEMEKDPATPPEIGGSVRSKGIEERGGSMEETHADTTAVADSQHNEGDLEVLEVVMADKKSSQAEDVVVKFDMERLRQVRRSASFRPDFCFQDRQGSARKKRRRLYSAATLDPGMSDKEAALAAAARELERRFNKADFKRMQVIGQFNLGFILGRINTDLFIVDQHASDEKYNFERLSRSTVLNRQPLLRPLPLELTASEEITVLSHMETFRRNGFDFMEVPDAPSGRRLRLTAVPFSKNITFGIADVQELISILADEAAPLPKNDGSAMENDEAALHEDGETNSLATLHCCSDQCHDESTVDPCTNATKEAHTVECTVEDSRSCQVIGEAGSQLSCEGESNGKQRFDFSQTQPTLRERDGEREERGEGTPPQRRRSISASAEEGGRRPSRVAAMLASRACRASVMIGTALSASQMRKILRQLADLDSPWNCPHGRPTMRHLVDLAGLKGR